MDHFRRGARRALTAVLALFLLGLTAASASASTSSEIAGLPVLDALNRNEESLSYGEQWSVLQWATVQSQYRTGQDTLSGWKPYDAYPLINGAYWNPKSFSGVGTAASLKMATNPGSEGGRYLALWLNMSNPGTAKSGYQFKWAENASVPGTYLLTLSRWSSGTQTVLNTEDFVKIPNGSSLAISKKGSTVTAWLNTAGTFKPVLFWEDNTFGSGYAGIEGSGNLSRSLDFKAGTIGSLAADIAEVPILDTFVRDEIPLSNGGKWTTLNWAATGPGRTTTSWGWNAPSTWTPSAGAYWNPQLLTDATSSSSTGGTVVAVTVGQLPTNEYRWASIWLNMPSPSTEQTGYQLTWRQATKTSLTAELYKWVAGNSELLASKEGVSIPAGTTVALSVHNDTLRAWTGTGANLIEILSASDSSYSGGYAGIEAAGAYSHLTNFRAGTLPGAPKLATLPVRDTFSRPNENPLSNGGKWAKASWAGNPGRVHEFGPSGLGYSAQNWGSLNNAELSSAYWQTMTFNETSYGNAVSVESRATSSTRRSLWLDMPSPGTAKSGYELSWKDNQETVSGGDFVLALSKWTAGSQTVLATQIVLYPYRLALVKKNGILSAWTASPFAYQDYDYRPQITVADSTYSSGYVGLEEPGFGEGGLANFSAGGLPG